MKARFHSILGGREKMKKERKKRSTSGKINQLSYREKGGAPMLYAGIDAHKRTCTIVIIDNQGVKIKEATVKTDELSIKGFFAPFKDKV